MTDQEAEIRSGVAGNIWPAIPSQAGARLLAMLFQLEGTQWWTARQLIDHQLMQLRMLLRHARETVPYYKDRLPHIRADEDLTLTEWRALPLLTRRDIQDAGNALFSRVVPAEFGDVFQTQTSGATGEPVIVRKTAIDQLIWEAVTLREHEWHRRDLSGKLASIRIFPKGGAEAPHGVLLNDWGVPCSHVYSTGPMALLSLATDVAAQARWLLRQDPDYFLTYPTNLAALIAHMSARGERLKRLRGVRTVGETVTPALRAACSDAWGVPLTDVYSSQEFGYIALQCPVSGQYHVMAESAMVEILRQDGSICEPGEVGKLVVTSLHNFATPLIRYELRDYAEVGSPCPCGRGLPTLARILGRSRNMLTLPSGEQRWPLVGFDKYREIAPVRQYQLIQKSLEEMEARFVVERTLTDAEEEGLKRVIQHALGYAFRLTFKYFPNEIPRGTGGKFEEFVSELAS
jgi:phenylacetate-CoA ligase